MSWCCYSYYERIQWVKPGLIVFFWYYTLNLTCNHLGVHSRCPNWDRDRDWWNWVQNPTALATVPASVSVSVQCVHLHTILYNPFFSVSVSDTVSVIAPLERATGYGSIIYTEMDSDPCMGMESWPENGYSPIRSKDLSPLVCSVTISSWYNYCHWPIWRKSLWIGIRTSIRLGVCE